MLYFFDSSAAAKLFHVEAGTDEVVRIFREPLSRIFVTRLTEVELMSVAGVKQRAGVIDREQAEDFARYVLVTIALNQFIRMRIRDEDFSVAAKLVRQYSGTKRLRTLDALHLASAVRCRARNRLDYFVTADVALAEIAALEGFATLLPGVRVN